MRLPWLVVIAVLLAVWAPTSSAQDSSVELARILAGKGVINQAELAKIEAASPEARVQALTSILQARGVLTQADVANLAPSQPPQALKPAEKAAGPAQSAPPVTSETKSPLTVYGTLLL